MNRLVAASFVAAGFVLAACGNAATAANSTTSPSPGAGNALRGGAAGQLVQINPQTLVLSGANGDITVDYTSTTPITKTSTAALADITTGMCVVATGQKDAAGLVTATTVRLSPKGANGCATGVPDGNGAPGASPRPVPSGQPAATFVGGEVTSVKGTSVTLLTQANGSQTITVPTTAAVTQSSAATASALQVGQCLRATGSRDSTGNVQASALTITPPGPSGTCTTGLGGPGRRPGNGTPAAGG
jgi:Domain of unknown function (DUF5666)